MGKIDFNRPFIIRNRRNGEWYWVQKSVLSSSLLKPSSKLVYNALAYYANNKNQTAFPSSRQIAKLIKINKDTVYSALKELEENKFIAIKKYSGKCNLYTLLKVVGNSDQSEIRGRGGRNKGVGVVGNKDTNKTNNKNYLTTRKKVKKTVNTEPIRAGLRKKGFNV